MSAPKICGVLPTYAITRSTVRDEARFDSSEQTTNDVLYHCGYAAEQRAVDIHFFALLPHQSLVICSPTEASVSPFVGDYHAQVARNINANQGLNGSLWRSGDPGEVQVLTIDQLVEIIARAVTMPVRAGLVDNLDDWEGVFLTVEDTEAEPIVCDRPEYCSERTGKPNQVILRLTECPLLELLGVTPEEFDSLLQARIQTKVAEALEERRVRNLPLHNIEEFEPTRRLPVEPEFQLPSEREFNLRVLLNPVYRLFRAFLRYFRSAYRQSLNEWRTTDDKSSIVFPMGTIKMRLLHNVPVEPFLTPQQFAELFDQMLE